MQPKRDPLHTHTDTEPAPMPWQGSLQDAAWFCVILEFAGKAHSEGP